MCDPVTIAGAALTAGGIGAKLIGSNAVSHANNALTQQTLFANAQQQQRIDAANEKARGRFDNFAQGEGARGAQLGDIITSAGHAPTTPGQIAPTTSENVAQAAAPAQAVVDASTQQRGRSLGEASAFGDYLGTVGRDVGRDLETANQATNFQQGNARLLGPALANAQHAGGTADLIGGIAGGLGDLGVKAGLSGASKSIIPALTSLAGFFG